MTTLEQLRASQHDDVHTPSDAARDAFLAGMDPRTAYLDLMPQTAVEARMLAHHQTEHR